MRRPSTRCSRLRRRLRLTLSLTQQRLQLRGHLSLARLARLQIVQQTCHLLCVGIRSHETSPLRCLRMTEPARTLAVTQ